MRVSGLNTQRDLIFISNKNNICNQEIEEYPAVFVHGKAQTWELYAGNVSIGNPNTGNFHTGDLHILTSH